MTTHNTDTTSTAPDRDEDSGVLAEVEPCESCGDMAQVRLADDSTWCLGCHCAALRLGYDTDLGTLIEGRCVSAEEFTAATSDASAA